MLKTAGHLFLTAWFAFAAVAMTGWACVSILVIAVRDPHSPLMTKIMERWAHRFLRLARTTMEVRGSENIDSSQSYVVVSNHRSDLDIPVDILATGLPIRFMAKKELFEVPVFGQTLRALGMIEVNRQQGASTHRVVNDAARLVSDHQYSIVVYPEGTRSWDGTLQPFKKGAASVAIEHSMPILPVTIQGSDQAWKVGGLIRGGHVRVEIGEPILTEGLTRHEVASLTEQTRQVIEAAYARLDVS